MKTCFPAVANADAEILLLGSMPGDVSLKKQQYYAHPRNAFWIIMGELFGASLELNYEDRLTKLKEHKIALWDVLQQCHRTGSMDSSIDTKTEQTNDFEHFLNNHKMIRIIGFNGKKAFNSFNKQFVKQHSDLSNNINLVVLPSTSPANAKLSTTTKIEEWAKTLSLSKYYTRTLV